MKIRTLLIPLLFSFCLCSTSCVVTHPGHKPPYKEIPPGHAKKRHKKKLKKPKPHQPLPPKPGKDYYYH